jgi:sigma-54 dependent transcriptional regulator, acetoin dehydrogenase operon transcriptional activator AcoR
MKAAVKSPSFFLRERPAADDPVREVWQKVVVDGEVPGRQIREEVWRSWLTCRNMGLDPFGIVSPSVLSGGELNRKIRANRNLIDFAGPMMDMIEISVRDTGFIVSLSDSNGCVLLVKGDQEIMEMAGHSYYQPGCMRAVEQAGTNAIGVCLIEGKPIQITGAEHYNIHFHPWTCSSAPIRGKERQILGVLTLSGRSIGRHKHTLALVTAAAETIEIHLRERELAKEKLHLSSMLSLVFDSMAGGVIAVDTDLTVTHINRKAVDMLGMDAGALVGRNLEEEVRPEKALLHAFKTRNYFSALEIGFGCAGGQRSFMCSIDPIRDSFGHGIGAIINLTEKTHAISMAKKLGGNYAKYRLSDIKGKDPELLRQIELAGIAAKTNSRVLIIGESGTGKELFAQAVHNESRRRHEPFVALSCATIPRDLIESELFGYRGGAFTGARRQGQVGKFELAHRGTLFLDEVNGLPLDLQAKLLRVLQQNEILRLGDTRPIPLDVRVLAASNCDLMREVEKDNFRKDLYYRLNVVEIFIPPLRRRIQDLDLLIRHIMKRLCDEMEMTRPEISQEVLQHLKRYTWPGNVRELENCLERALLLAQGATIERVHIPARILKECGASEAPRASLHQGYKRLIENSLDHCNGNISMAARQLGIARSTLYRKIREFGLSQNQKEN